MYTFDSALSEIKGIGEKRAQSFKKLGVNNLYDLIHFYPRNYMDFSCVTSISKLTDGQTACVKAVLNKEFELNYVSAKMRIYKSTVSDDTGKIAVTFFNTPYIAQSLKVGEEYLFYAKAAFKGKSLMLNSPIVISANEENLIRPIYPQTASLKSNAISKYVFQALKISDMIAPADPVPVDIRHKYRLCTEQFALWNINFPKSSNDLETAKKRLIFEELFVLQCAMQKMKSSSEKKSNYILSKDYTYDFTKSLPFKLTNAQKRCIYECMRNMQSGFVMNRLLQGDVGCGKTAVACAVIYSAVRNGFQCALMAPTEILAKQHYDTLKKLLPQSVSTVLLTGSVKGKEKKQIKESIAKGTAQVVVGTHALLTGDVVFDNLGLVITDEQHRFGVGQRAALSSKGNSPHVLVMSATPIPRTLSLIIYGELDISVIDEMPKGRQKTDTYAVDSTYKKRIYSYIKKYLDSGRQGYIVCPAVEESESGIISAVKYAKELSETEFASYSVGLLHGKMKPKEKNDVMADFASGKIQLLVSTTVIEVGIDVPNASIMVIENAERFGLSQLHQLRGRVGRGGTKSSCILISDAKNEETKIRLGTMKKTNDGFVIAKEDLALRGPGDFLGFRQHGLPLLKIASLAEDMTVLEKASQAAKQVLLSDPKLEKEENKGLLQAIDRLFSESVAIN